MSLKTFRRIDLVVFFFLMCLSEIMSLLLFGVDNNKIYFSFSILIFFIISYRWNLFAIIPYLMFSIVIFVLEIYFFHFSILDSFLMNIVGNSLGILICVANRYLKLNEIRKSRLLLAIYLVVTFLVIGISKGIALSLINHSNVFSNAIYFAFRYQALSLFASIILLMFLKGIKNLVVDEKNYLINLKEEPKDDWLQRQREE